MLEVMVGFLFDGVSAISVYVLLALSSTHSFYTISDPFISKKIDHM